VQRRRRKMPPTPSARSAAYSAKRKNPETFLPAKIFADLLRRLLVS
jgi:hypothetical protein